MNRLRMAQAGLGLCGLALVIGLVASFVPFGPKGQAPLPLTLLGVAGFFYIPGAFLVFYAEHKVKPKWATKILGYVRWAFAAVFIWVMVRMLMPYS